MVLNSEVFANAVYHTDKKTMVVQRGRGGFLVNGEMKVMKNGTKWAEAKVSSGMTLVKTCGFLFLVKLKGLIG